jgi:hypothetical protein
MIITDLLNSVIDWFKNVTKLRLENKEVGYSWVYKDIGYNLEPTVENHQKFFDRKDQNDEYLKQYNQIDITVKKPYIQDQVEINAIAGFHKCFAMRYNSRLQYYRNDLSQKGARTQSALIIDLGKMAYNRKFYEKSS